ncbi:hypothetical protein TNCV_3623691 [Trichonephila clavipes]|nr:hypothetical protein TNCV_3623691 [Trichonephila clavipes]
MFCINCQTVGHMANYAKCPLYPKPKKGGPTKNNNSYTNVINSIVRPNLSYASFLSKLQHSNRNQQIDTPAGGDSSVPPKFKPISTVTFLNALYLAFDVNIPFKITPIQVNNENPNVNLISQTLQSSHDPYRTNE